MARTTPPAPTCCAASRTSGPRRPTSARSSSPATRSSASSSSAACLSSVRNAEAGAARRSETVRATDHVEHDLVGARADPVQPLIPESALDLVLLHVAVAAVDLHALVGDLVADPCGEQDRKSTRLNSSHLGISY